jgi:phage tail-like protein
MNPAIDTRSDPYKNYKFRLWVEGRWVAGANSMTGVTPFAGAVYRAGGDPSNAHKSPGRNKYEAITLERGVTQDLTFNNWARQVSQFGSSAGQTSTKNFRKDVYLQIYNEAGQPVQRYQFLKGWVSKYRALPRLGGNANAIAIEHLEIEHEGWVVVPVHRG